MQLLRLDSHKQIHAIKITVDPVERHPGLLSRKRGMTTRTSTPSPDNILATKRIVLVVLYVFMDYLDFADYLGPSSY